MTLQHETAATDRAGQEEGGGDGRQLLEGQAERQRLQASQVVHHELPALGEHDRGCGLGRAAERALRRHQREALHRAEPGQRPRELRARLRAPAASTSFDDPSSLQIIWEFWCSKAGTFLSVAGC